jgi:prolipoprotein diacylglyceryltransferase
MNQPAYTTFMLLATVAFVLVRAMMPRQSAELPWDQRLILGLSAFVGGAFGAKLPFALGADSGLTSHTAWISDGKTITTGLAGAYLAVEAAKWLLGVRAKTGDSFALPLACALAVGRWGCFFNGCCHGTPTDLLWGCDFHLADEVGVRRHPTQAYESLFHLTMAVVLWFCLRYRLLVNNQLKLYLISYAGYRFLTEFIRPEPRDWAGLTFYQWVSAAMAAGLAVQWWFDRRPDLASGGQDRNNDAVAVEVRGRP